MKVFIAGPRAITKLNNMIEERLKNIYTSNISVLVGDAAGIDKVVQEFYHNLNYSDVNVYAVNGKARNNIGSWPVKNVEVEKNIRGFGCYATKDIKMAEDADYGFMIWNGKSKGTLNNMINLIKYNKQTLLYFYPENQFYNIRNSQNLELVIDKCEAEAKIMYERLTNSTNQIALVDLK